MISVIPIKAWIATNGAFIAAVLATNATNNLPTGIQLEDAIVAVTNGLTPRFLTNTVTMTNFYTPEVVWYQAQVSAWWIVVAVAVGFSAAIAILTIIRDRVTLPK